MFSSKIGKRTAKTFTNTSTHLRVCMYFYYNIVHIKAILY